LVIFVALVVRGTLFLRPGQKMRLPLIAGLGLALMCLSTPTLVGQQSPQPAAPVFRSIVNLILVDVVVRDKKGAVMTGLTADDFQLVEDGKPQQIVTFAYEEIAKTSRPLDRASILAGAAPLSPAVRVGPPSAASRVAAPRRTGGPATGGSSFGGPPPGGTFVGGPSSDGRNGFTSLPGPRSRRGGRVAPPGRPRGVKRAAGPGVSE
jgi:hypothetical protein